MTTLLEILGCKYPIIQGPIGQLNDPKMIAAVSEAGAFGVLALASEESPASKEWKEAIISCGDAGTTLLPISGMAMRTIINPKLEELLASGADLSLEYNIMNADGAWSTGDFDLFPAGAGQISALIKEFRPVKDIIDGMVS